MMFLKFIPLLIVLQGSRCSMVYDKHNQKGIHVSDYCPSTKYCPEGAHTMCVYYDPKHTFGPRCSNPQNISMTPELANQILDVLNAIRSKIAKGLETGKNNTLLPRGYGMFRLKWDNELATFAQVFANHCMLRHDFCRASQRFPDAAQSAGISRFPYPGWEVVLPNKVTSTTTDLTEEKLSLALIRILKTWYKLKSYMTPAMITKYPDWDTEPDKSSYMTRPYLDIIRANTTHIGCGISAYKEFVFYQNRPGDGKYGGITYNTVQIICNFSARTPVGTASYSTSYPNGAGGACGCPYGAEEAEDCLCNEVPVEEKQFLSTGTQSDPETCQNPENNCEPTLVLLPIFTVEDAPPEKLLERARNIEKPLATYVMDRLDNRNKTSIVPRTSPVDVFNFFDDAAEKHQVPSIIPHPLKSILMDGPEIEDIKSPKPTPNIIQPQMPSKGKYVPPRNEYNYPETEVEPFSEPEQALEAEVVPEPEPKPIQTKNVLRTPKRSPSAKKPSIFTRVAKFRLPNRRRNFGQTIKPDVKPRKDFKNIERVVNDYFKRRNNKMGYRRNEVVTNKHEETFEKFTTTTIKVEESTEVVLSKAEEKLMNANQYFKQNVNSTIEDNLKQFDLRYEESDNKLMNLLDTLEREVKYIELDGDEKEIFDAKIRKIYGSVVGKPDSKPLVSNPDRDSDFLESDFGESKAYLKHESNHITPNNIRTRSEFLSDDEKNLDKKGKSDYLDHKHKEKIDRKYIKNPDTHKFSDIYDNFSFNENEMFNNDQKLFSDIERKYNERLARTYNTIKLDRKYSDTDNFQRKYEEILGRRNNDIGEHKNLKLPAPRAQNKLTNYRNIKPRTSSTEERKLRSFDKYHERELLTGLSRDDNDKHYFRNCEGKKHYPVDDKRSKILYSHNEFEHDDPMTAERRKYYQDKLENLERKIHSTRAYRRRKNDDMNNEWLTRRVRPNLKNPDIVRPRSKTQADTFYMPDRARFLHGF